MDEREGPATDGEAPPRGGAGKACSRCGGPFVCGAAASEPCWCAGLEPLTTLSPVADCLCPTCLREALAREDPRRSDPRPKERVQADR